MRHKWKGRPGGTTRPHTCEADRDVLEDLGLADIDDPTEDPDPQLAHHDELMAS